jgi:hypothetical protein
MKKLLVLGLLYFCFVGSVYGQAQKSILLSVLAEKEGPNGLWIQFGTDLTTTELVTFQQMLKNAVSVVKDITLVKPEDPREHVVIMVSLVKVPRGKATWWYSASSVIGVAKPPETDEFVTHDVVVGGDLSVVAKAIAFIFASARFQMVLERFSKK